MDLRVEKTYAALNAAFTELLESMPYEQISVAKLCEAATIRRTTFYKHFADKDEFFTFYLKGVRDDFESRCGVHEGLASMPDRCTLMSNELVQFLLDHEQLVEHIIDSPSLDRLMAALTEVMTRNMQSMLEHAPSTKLESRQEEMMYCQLISGGMIQVLRSWWANGHHKQEIPAMSALFHRMHTAICGDEPYEW